VVTTVIACLALAVSVASLLWQVASWRNSGPRIRAVVVRHNPVRGMPGAYAIVLSNDGRQAVTVVRVRLKWRKGLNAADYNIVYADWGADIKYLKSDRLPITIEPGAEVRVYASLKRVEENMSKLGLEQKHLIPQAQLGTTWVGDQ
jgi:hypothetical protein